MDKKKWQPFALVVLIMVFIFAAKSSFKKKRSDKSVSSGAPSAVTAAKPVLPQPVKTESGNKTGDIAQLERVNLPWGRDPFTLSSEKIFQAGQFELRGISFGKGQVGYAFINNEIVKEGDKIGNYEVVEIHKDRVLIKKDSQSFYITFGDKE